MRVKKLRIKIPVKGGISPIYLKRSHTTIYMYKFEHQICDKTMEFSIKLHAIKSGWLIVYIEGSHVIIFKRFCISFFKYLFYLSKKMQTLMKCRIMLHFIWVFTVCQVPVWRLQTFWNLQVFKGLRITSSFHFYSLGLCGQEFCQNGGKCIGVDQCSCPAGYIGQACETTGICVNRVYQSNGTLAIT